MSTVEQIKQVAQQLPEELQAEVLHYAEYLRARSQQNGDSEERRHAIVAILEQLAARPERVTGEDPVEWQRTERKDRDLSSR
jgi:hypothetical protein